MRRVEYAWKCATAAIVILPLFLGAQTLPAQKPAFEVASIKPIAEPGQVFLDVSKVRFRATNVSLRLLLRYAFDSHLPKDGMGQASVLFSSASGIQVVGGPSWIGNDRFYIEAKPPGGDAVSQEDMQLMMQSLLEDRFQLKVHREMREVPTFDLVVVKQGKMKLSGDEVAFSSARNQGERPLPQLPPGALSTFGLARGPILTMLGNRVAISTLVTGLESWARRPITDKTNLQGFFDVFVEFNPSGALAPVSSSLDGPQGVPVAATDPSGPSIFNAVEQELGLKLVPSKASMEVLVIDSVQRPSEN